ncbi:MAG: YlcI/YnfO family protein [Gordonibacter sp.]|uniref:YlcI/YnfO family protein n=1 Tax=Gordonibacter sp. TaxID=1968902 RepID=UPI002FC96E8C
MKYSDLLNEGSSEVDIQRHLAGGDPVAITIRIPRNLKEAAVEAAELKGMTFSAYIRTCLIDDLSKGAK